MSIIDTLITDRTIYDARRWARLNAIGWDKMTDVERHEWAYGNSNIYWADGETITCLDGEIIVDGVSNKGAYNDIDLNRVEEAAGYLSRLLKSLPESLREYAESIGVAWDDDFDMPYAPEKYGIETKTDWAGDDTTPPEEMERYLANVALLRTALDYRTDALPESMEDLTYSGANAIEKALVGLSDGLDELEEGRRGLIENVVASFRQSGQFTFWSGSFPLPV